MLIIQKQPTTISNQCIFKLLTVNSAINDRFGQPALKKFRNVEELFLKAINQADSSKELKVLESELDLVPAIIKQSTLGNFSWDLQDVSRHGWRKKSSDKECLDHRTKRPNKWCDISYTRMLYFNVEEKCRYSSLSVLNVHTDIMDNLSLVEVAKRFTNAKERRRNECGTITEKDLNYFFFFFFFWVLFKKLRHS